MLSKDIIVADVLNSIICMSDTYNVSVVSTRAQNIIKSMLKDNNLFYILFDNFDVDGFNYVAVNGSSELVKELLTKYSYIVESNSLFDNITDDNVINMLNRISELVA